MGEAARLKAEEEARLKAEEEARLKAEVRGAAVTKLQSLQRGRVARKSVNSMQIEAARLKAEAEEEAARLKAEEEARLKAEEYRAQAEAAAVTKLQSLQRGRTARRSSNLMKEEVA